MPTMKPSMSSAVTSAAQRVNSPMSSSTREHDLDAGRAQPSRSTRGRRERRGRRGSPRGGRRGLEQLGEAATRTGCPPARGGGRCRSRHGRRSSRARSSLTPSPVTPTHRSPCGTPRVGRPAGRLSSRAAGAPARGGCQRRRTPRASSAASAHGGHALRRRPGVEQEADERRTDDDAVGVRRDLGRLGRRSRRRDPPRPGRAVWARVRSTSARCRGRRPTASTGDAHERRGVDEAGGERR